MLAYAGAASGGRGPKGQAERRKQEEGGAGKGQIGPSWLQGPGLGSLVCLLHEGDTT